MWHVVRGSDAEAPLPRPRKGTRRQAPGPTVTVDDRLETEESVDRIRFFAAVSEAETLPHQLINGPRPT